jgi:hypothetical protein
VCSDRNLVKFVIALGARWTKQRSKMPRRSDAEVDMKLVCLKMKQKVYRTPMSEDSV